MVYVITAPGMANPLVSVHKHKAASPLRWAGYDALQGGGQIDTQAGHRVANSYNAVADAIEAGAYTKGSSTVIPLPHGSGALTVKRV